MPVRYIKPKGYVSARRYKVTDLGTTATGTTSQVIKFSRTTTDGNWNITTENYTQNAESTYNFTRQWDASYSLPNTDKQQLDYGERRGEDEQEGK